MFKLKDLRANSVGLDEVAHYEPPLQDLRCLQIQLISSLVFKELRVKTSSYEGHSYMTRPFCFTNETLLSISEG